MTEWWNNNFHTFSDSAEKVLPGFNTVAGVDIDVTDKRLISLQGEFAGVGDFVLTRPLQTAQYIVLIKSTNSFLTAINTLAFLIAERILNSFLMMPGLLNNGLILRSLYSAILLKSKLSNIVFLIRPR